MMVKQTSLEIYEKLRDSGQLGRQQRRILEFMVPGYKYTRLELSEATDIPINAVCGRMNELIRAGMVEVDGHIRCPVTGNNVEGVVRRL